MMRIGRIRVDKRRSVVASTYRNGANRENLGVSARYLPPSFVIDSNLSKIFLIGRILIPYVRASTILIPYKLLRDVEF